MSDALHGSGSGWARAAASAFQVGPTDDEPAPKVATQAEANQGSPLGTDVLIVTDHFDIMSIEIPIEGARIAIQPLTKADALRLVRGHPHIIQGGWDRSLGMLERELQLDTIPRACASYGTRLLVVNQRRWNDVGFYLVTWECDGNGVIP
jgi:hypothetical protein